MCLSTISNRTNFKRTFLEINFRTKYEIILEFTVGFYTVILVLLPPIRSTMANTSDGGKGAPPDPCIANIITDAPSIYLSAVSRDKNGHVLPEIDHDMTDYRTTFEQDSTKTNTAPDITMDVTDTANTSVAYTAGAMDIPNLTNYHDTEFYSNANDIPDTDMLDDADAADAATDAKDHHKDIPLDRKRY